MKKILPFQGILYNQHKIESMADVVSPPYDVISDEMQDELYERSPYNFCRLDLTKETGEERYQIAKDLFQSWIDEGILVFDDKPAIYVHHHTFTLPKGKKVTRKGFFAARRIEDFSEGGIKPHEKTLEGPKADRLNMTKATKANLSPVFSLYSDPDLQIDDNFNRLTQTTCYLDFVSPEGERHQIWKCKDPKTIEFIDQTLSDKPLFIADGHHRYETALNYRNEVLAEQHELPEQSACRYLLMYFSNMNDEGMVVLPIHRALHSLKNIKLDEILEKLSPYFDVKEVPAQDVDKNLADISVLKETHHAFWLIAKNLETSYILSLKRDQWLEMDLAKQVPECLAKLDVTVLHHLIFNHILGLTEESQARQENLVYLKSTEKAISETKKGNCDYTFILNPTRIEDVQAVALEGQKMPQKSTYFYPKIISGLVLHSVDANKIDG